MNTKGNNNEQKKIIQNTLDSITKHHGAPMYVFFILAFLYIAVSIIIRVTSGSHETISIGSSQIPIAAFAGVLSSLSNICLILLTLFFGKWGFYTALITILIQFPVIISVIIMHHNLNNLPGVFGNLLTLVTIIIIYFNNKELDAYQVRVRDQAVTDRLTGLPNRFACSELIEDLTKNDERFAVVSIDINGFKSIKSSMGFEAGNEVLIEIATRWKAIADTGISGTLDFITRTSGDEFVLIIRNYHSDEDIINTIRQYEAALKNRLTIDNCDFYITASFGYSEYPADAGRGDSVFAYADAALHEVKRANSGDHILRFTPDLLKIERTIEIEGKIREALEKDTIFFNLQPQFDMDHKLRGFEALARMKDENGENINPGEFIPVAEKVGLIDKVDSAVFRKATSFFGELLEKSGADLTLSINASVRHLMKNSFIDEVRELLESSGISPDKLEIEITESIMIDSADKALKCISELQKMGVKLAIDDFGTGYSSLSYLNSFPANMLKIDKSFIDKMNSTDSSRQYVAAIISIGHIMGFEVISEGVEEDAQLTTLRTIGCDYIQGFLWGRPLSQQEAEELVMQFAGK